MTAAKKTERTLWIVTWIAAVLPFLGYWMTGLFDVDEGFYAAVISEMMKRGDFIIPYYNGLPWFEKPILIYWLTIPCVALFGEDFGPRLPSVLASLGTMAACAWFVRKHFSDQMARRTVLILATTLLFVFVGRMLLMDPVMVLFFTLSILYLLESMLGNPQFKWLSGFCLGLAVLAKGPVSIAFFIAIVLFIHFRKTQWRPKLHRQWIGFISACLVAIAIWYVPAYLREPQAFVDIFILKHNVYRLLGGDDAHRVPLWLSPSYFVIVLAIGTMPWWPFALRNWKQPVDDDRQDLALFGFKVWAAVVFAVFTVSGTKLPHYILPAVVPGAMLAAFTLAKRDALKPSFAAALALSWGGAFFVSYLVNSIALIQYQNSNQALAHRLIKTVRGTPTPVATYQLIARERKVGLQTSLQETSLPSLNFYLRRIPLDLNSFEEITGQPTSLYVFTRAGRISREDIAKAESMGWDVARIAEARVEEAYELYFFASPLDAAPRRPASGQ
jgi:4-amino-4-deoxy-L-arabinose transferase-like glycosyltransferase